MVVNREGQVWRFGSAIFLVIDTKEAPLAPGVTEHLCLLLDDVQSPINVGTHIRFYEDERNSWEPVNDTPICVRVA
jgi:hypothetical protein